jgi:hypothetical protein
MKISLHKLACELAKMDAPGGYNQTVIGSQTTLHNLGKYLRGLTTEQALLVVAALVRDGKRGK